MEQFPQTVETQPELVAHHYTEAGLIEQAIPYWQQAGERAMQRSANVEAISHLTKGLELLKTLPDTPERIQQELTLQMPWALPLMRHQRLCGPGSGKSLHPGAGAVSAGRRNPSALPGAVGTVGVLCYVRAELQTARELGEQLLSLAQKRTRPGSPCWRPTMTLGVDFVLPGRVCLSPRTLRAGHCPL